MRFIFITARIAPNSVDNITDAKAMPNVNGTACKTTGKLTMKKSKLNTIYTF